MKYKLQRVDLQQFLEVEVPPGRLSPELRGRIAQAVAAGQDLQALAADAVAELLANGTLTRAGKLHEPGGAVPVYALPNSPRVYDLRRFLGRPRPTSAESGPQPSRSKTRATHGANGEAWASVEAMRSVLRRDWVSLGLESTLDGLLTDLRTHLNDPEMKFVLWEDRFGLPITEGRAWRLLGENHPAGMELLRRLTREDDAGATLHGRRWFGVWASQQILGAVGVDPSVPRALASEASAAFGDLLGNYRRSQRRVYTDPLTGANNRGYFDHQLPVELERSRRASSPLALLFVDLDHFKQVNDTHGHEVGDLALQHATRLFESGLRRIDYVFRWGGEEFALLLPATDQTEALNTAERVRAQLEASPLVLPDGQELTVTASFGVSLFPDLAKDPAELVRTADAALYQAKQAGRNRVSLYRA